MINYRFGNGSFFPFFPPFYLLNSDISGSVSFVYLIVDFSELWFYVSKHFLSSFKLLHGWFSLKSRGLAECHTFGHIALTDPYPKSFTRFDEAETGIALVLQIFSDRGFRWIYLPAAAAAVPLPDRVHPVFGTGIRNGAFRWITLGRSTGSQTEN